MKDRGERLALITTKDRLEFIINIHNNKLIGHKGIEKLLHGIQKVVFVQNIGVFLDI